MQILLKDFCEEKLERDPTLTEEKSVELRHVLAVLDDLSSEELGTKIKEYGITAPDTKNPLSDLNWSLWIQRSFSLMFQTSIGPSGPSPGYMRPETAQGIFVNFKDLYYYNGSKLPLAAAQIGQAFRNEVSGSIASMLLLHTKDRLPYNTGYQISVLHLRKTRDEIIKCTLYICRYIL